MSSRSNRKNKGSSEKSKKPSREKAHARYHDRRRGGTRTALYLAVVAITLAAAGYFLKPAIFGRGGPGPDATVIDVAADMGGFDQRVIRVKAGEPVTVRLTSLDNRFHTDGGGRHQFAVDELGVSIIAPALGSASDTFTPSEPGTYIFYCDICCGGRANPSMSGKLVVVEA